MSLLTYIKDVPLFSTVNEAVEWAESKTLLSYHTHKYKNIVGYMGGLNHTEAFKYPGVVLPKLPKPTHQKRFGQKTRVINPTQGVTLNDSALQTPLASALTPSVTTPTPTPVLTPTITTIIPPTSGGSGGGGGY